MVKKIERIELTDEYPEAVVRFVDQASKVLGPYLTEATILEWLKNLHILAHIAGNPRIKRPLSFRTSVIELAVLPPLIALSPDKEGDDEITRIFGPAIRLNIPPVLEGALKNSGPVKERFDQIKDRLSSIAAELEVEVSQDGMQYLFTSERYVTKTVVEL